MLKSLGVAGDNAADVELKESLTDLVTEIVDDRYLANFGRQETDPELTYAEALALALAVVDDPCAQLRPPDPEPGSKAAVRLRFAAEVLEELERRKGRLRAQGFNDLLIRLATASRRPTRQLAIGCGNAGGSCWWTSFKIPTPCSGGCSSARLAGIRR